MEAKKEYLENNCSHMSEPKVLFLKPVPKFGVTYNDRNNKQLRRSFNKLLEKIICKFKYFYAYNLDNFTPSQHKLYEVVSDSLSEYGFKVYWKSVDEAIRKLDRGDLEESKATPPPPPPLPPPPPSSTWHSTGWKPRNTSNSENQWELSAFCFLVEGLCGVCLDVILAFHVSDSVKAVGKQCLKIPGTVDGGWAWLHVDGVESWSFCWLSTQGLIFHWLCCLCCLRIWNDLTHLMNRDHIPWLRCVTLSEMVLKEVNFWKNLSFSHLWSLWSWKKPILVPFCHFDRWSWKETFTCILVNGLEITQILHF